MLFFSLLFIFQSKEFPRNVPGNQARECVDQQVRMLLLPLQLQAAQHRSCCSQRGTMKQVHFVRVCAAG